MVKLDGVIEKKSTGSCKFPTLGSTVASTVDLKIEIFLSPANTNDGLYLASDTDI